MFHGVVATMPSRERAFMAWSRRSRLQKRFGSGVRAKGSEDGERGASIMTIAPPMTAGRAAAPSSADRTRPPAPAPRASLAAGTASANSGLLGGEGCLFVRALPVQARLRHRSHAGTSAVEARHPRFKLPRRFRATLFGSDRRAAFPGDDRGDLACRLLAPHLHAALAVADHLPHPRTWRLRGGDRWKRKCKQKKTKEPAFMSPSGQMPRPDIPEYRVLPWKETPLAFGDFWSAAPCAGLGKAGAIG